MQVIVNSQALATELRLVNKVVPSKPAIQILGHVLLIADVESGLRLFGTDLDIGLTTRCAATVRMKGRCALPAGRLLQIVEQFTDGDVELTAGDKAVTVRFGSYSTKLQSGEHDDFPELPVPEGDTSIIDADALRSLIDHTRRSVSQAGQTRVLQGGCLTIKDGVAAMAATDGKRLSLATVAASGTNVRVSVPTKALDLLAAQQDAGSVTITINRNHMFFETGGRQVNSRAIDGEYPAYERIIPRDNDKIVKADRLALTAALRRVVLTAEDTKGVRFNITPGKLELWSSSAGIGSGSEVIAVDYDGEPIKVWMNGDYALDFLEVAARREVVISLKNDVSASLFADGNDYIGVIMLMKQS